MCVCECAHKEPSPFSFFLWVTTLRKISAGDERWLQQRNTEVAYVLSLCQSHHHRTPVLSVKTEADSNPAGQPGIEPMAETETNPEPKSATNQDLVAKEEAGQIRNCPKCGNVLKLGKKFCSKCGYSLQTTNAPEAQQEAGQGVNCPKCGNLLKPGKKFCPACGLRIQ